MRDLEKEQREMRERMQGQTKAKTKEVRRSLASDEQLLENDTSTVTVDVKKLQQRITALETENSELRAEIERLRLQKTVNVEREKSPEAQRREQQHNYFKYSNTRRW